MFNIFKNRPLKTWGIILDGKDLPMSSRSTCIQVGKSCRRFDKTVRIYETKDGIKTDRTELIER